ncbi:MAG TPA: hypothetical protein VGN23_08235 [Verrucomicrobiae bacterium]|jgi:hypothetical protein
MKSQVPGMAVAEIAQSRKLFSIVYCLCVLICMVLGVEISAKASQPTAFTLSGRFDDVFAGKHDLGGVFTVSAFESNALVDVTFENGFHEIVGTDGHDSFDYHPSVATISFGRFPANSHEVQQYLWLICAQDPELISNVHNYPFGFYAEFSTNDLVEEIATNGVLPGNFISSIKWYNGTTNQKFTLYPKGYLMAELSVTRTETNGVVVYPGEITFQQFNMMPFDNRQLKKDERGYITNLSSFERDKNDVVSIQLTRFSITNFQTVSPLTSYIPEILDKQAQVDDEREPEMGLVRVASSGKWWTARELFNKRFHIHQSEPLVKPHRHLVLFLVSLVSSIIIMLGIWGIGKMRQQ